MTTLHEQILARMAALLDVEPEPPRVYGPPAGKVNAFEHIESSCAAITQGDVSDSVLSHDQLDAQVAWLRCAYT